MVHKSLHLQLPSSVPFDKANWFESFVGNFVLPLHNTGLINRYWFSRYLDESLGKHVRFRFFTDDYIALETNISTLISQWQLKDLGDEESYTPVDDLGSSRFLGHNPRQTDTEDRANKVYDFLYATCRLYVDFLSHHDADGYWYSEKEIRSGQNYETAFESLHHLYCNITDCPTFVVEAIHPDNPQSVYLSRLYYSWAKNSDSRWSVKRDERVRF